MTRFSLLALLAVAASAPLAAAQTPVFEVRDASGATLHFAVNDDGTVTCTDCISPDAISVPFYHDKSQVYTVSETLQVSSSTGTLRAICLDPNDLPIGSECDTGPANSAISLKNIRNLNWSSSTVAAGVECVAMRTGGAFTETLTARMYCLAVPGDGTATTRGGAAVDLGPSRTDDL